MVWTKRNERIDRRLEKRGIFASDNPKMRSRYNKAYAEEADKERAKARSYYVKKKTRQFILLNRDGGLLRGDSLAYGDDKKEVSRNWGFPVSHIRTASRRNKKRWGFRV